MLRLRTSLFYRTSQSSRKALLSSNSLQSLNVSAPPSWHSPIPNLTQRCPFVRRSASDEYQCVLLFWWRRPRSPSSGDQPQKPRARGQFALLEKSLRSYCEYLSAIERSHQRKTRTLNLPPLPLTFPDWRSAKSAQNALHPRRLHVNSPCAPYARFQTSGNFIQPVQILY